MAFLQWVSRPEMDKFRGVILRRTMVQVTGPGGPAETGQEIYQQFGAQWKVKDSKFIFPNKATIVCKGCEQEKDKHNFQGWQVSAFLVDEAQQFEESQIVYFISRMRTAAPMKPVMMMTANPAYDCYLRKWLEAAGYLDEKGLPRKDRDGKKMWFVRQGDQMIWAETAEELEARYGENCGPMSFIFLPANCHDNPVLIERDPSYVFKLQNMPRVEMERLYLGSWYARETSSGMFKREWLAPEVQNYPDPTEIVKVCRAWDLAGSLKSETTPDPDYSCGVKFALLRNGDYIILNVIRFRARYGEVERKIIDIAHADGKHVDIVTPVEPGQAGKAAARMLAKAITAEGFYVRMKPTNRSKEERFRPAASACENGLVRMVADCCDDLENKTFGNNDWFYAELEAFTPKSKKGHDDAVDAFSDAFEYLATSKKIPIGFKLPSFTETNPFAFN